MGPAPQNHLPFRPLFSWDSKTAPWTDGKGDQEGYFKSVKLWNAFNDALPDNNSTKIPTRLRALCLKSQLFGRAADLCSGIDDESLTTTEGVKLIVDCIYQRDALSVVSEAFRAFNALLNTRRGDTENMKNFQSRFSAQVAKFNAISNTTKPPECSTALMLLSNSAIDDNQRVSVLAATPPADPTLNSQSTNDMFLSAVTYQSVASIVKQCDRTHTTSVNQNSLAASSAGTTQRYGHSSPQNRGRTRPTKAEYEALMMKHPCNLCGKFDHWKRSHSSDGSLPAHVKAVEKGDRNRAYAPVGKKKSVSFNMAKLIGSSAATTVSKDLGPLVHDGAPYSAIGLVELKWRGKKLDPALSLTINPIPMTLNGYSHWQYGTGEHASQSRKILGSVVLTAQSDGGRLIDITHLVLQGSSQWVIGRYVTRKANIEHIGRNTLTFEAHGEQDYISLTNSGFLSYVLLTDLLNRQVEAPL